MMLLPLFVNSVYSYYRFFTEIASDCETLDAGNHSLSFINDANVLALHRLLWNNQEKIGDYLSSSRCVLPPLITAFCNASDDLTFHSC